MRRVVVLIFLAVVGIFVVVSSTSRRPAYQGQPPAVSNAVPGGRLAFDASRPSLPFVFVYMTPKYPLPGEEVVGGLKVAVWQDGKVVRARSAAEVGAAYIQGTLEPGQLDELVRSIERAGILETPPDQSVPHHEASDVLRIRTRDGSLAWSHSVPSKESARVKLIEAMLSTIEISNPRPIAWEIRYPPGWDE